MNRPPCFMGVRIRKPDRKISLWLPLFIILPLIFIILLILAPFILLAAIILWPMGYGRPLLGVAPAILSCLCAMRGLEVEIAQSQERVHIFVK
jgi:hypothetical protein